MTFARKVDANHKAIAEAFRRCGCLVHHTIGDWDLTVSKFKMVALIEVKDGNKSPSRRKLTPRSQKLIDEGWPIHRVESLDDVLMVCALLRQAAMAQSGET